LLAGATAEDALSVADRIHRGLATSKEAVFDRVRPTTSTGVASSRSAEVPLAVLLRRADVALYRAKEEGRNRTVLFDDALARAMRDDEANSQTSFVSTGEWLRISQAVDRRLSVPGKRAQCAHC